MKTKFDGASFLPSFLPSRRATVRRGTDGRTERAREEALESAESRVFNARRRCQRLRARATFFSRKDKKKPRARDVRLRLICVGKKNNFNADCTRAPSLSFSPCLVGDDGAFLFLVFLTSRPRFGDFFLECRVLLRVIVVR